MSAINGKKYWLKTGESVAHITNLAFEMSIKELLYRRAEIFCDEKEPNSYFSTEQHRWIRNKKLLIGVRCHWMQDGEMKEQNFHSKELVPWHIAKKGPNAVDKFRGL